MKVTWSRTYDQEIKSLLLVKFADRGAGIESPGRALGSATILYPWAYPTPTAQPNDVVQHTPRGPLR
jgi:hypothetical protein